MSDQPLPLTNPSLLEQLEVLQGCITVIAKRSGGSVTVTKQEYEEAANILVSVEQHHDRITFTVKGFGADGGEAKH